MAANKASISFQKERNSLTTPQNHQIVINMSNNLYGSDRNKVLSKKLIEKYSTHFISYSYEEYIEKANKLINDDEVRHKCSTANREIINNFFHNPENPIELTLNNLEYICK